MGLVFPVLVLAALVVFEVYGNVVERGVGYYLKWHNADRQQLGRSWDKERKNILAQNKIQSILASLDLQAQSNESIESFKDLLETLSSPRIISREKFLRLYFDYPGQWLHPIIAPYELLEIDSDKKWSRVLLSRTDLSVSVGFVDQQNNPIREVVLSSDVLEEIRDSRTIRRGLLEDAGFKGDLLFPIREFLPLLQTLDLAAQRSLFPDPEWFLKKDYHVTRMGVLAEDTVAMLGVEYKTDFYTEVLLIPLSPEVANNILSQIERSDFGISKPRLGKVGDEPREEMR
ncbi:MAG: hypothetical protein A3K09_02160 [Nitrospinae bacterium RIFCSPLOWO2_12_FULL_47_7]|nr:MAG: hypothetical protein A3K09_02160 [Nitrospinae bacterium RIFCSPLOWO2_12_FULL_47_7]